MFSVVNMCFDHLKFCVLMGCCSECYFVSNECDEPTHCIMQPVGALGGEVMYFLL